MSCYASFIALPVSRARASCPRAWLRGANSLRDHLPDKLAPSRDPDRRRCRYGFVDSADGYPTLYMQQQWVAWVQANIAPPFRKRPLKAALKSLAVGGRQDQAIAAANRRGSRPRRLHGNFRSRTRCNQCRCWLVSWGPIDPRNGVRNSVGRSGTVLDGSCMAGLDRHRLGRLGILFFVASLALP